MEEHCFIISYDLLQPNRDYDELYAAIKSYSIWGRLTESTWAIVTNQSYIEIRNFLRTHIDSNDRLIVIQSGRSAAWTKIMASEDWAKSALIK